MPLGISGEADSVATQMWRHLPPLRDNRVEAGALRFNFNRSGGDISQTLAVSFPFAIAGVLDNAGLPRGLETMGCRHDAHEA